MTLWDLEKYCTLVKYYTIQWYCNVSLVLWPGIFNQWYSNFTEAISSIFEEWSSCIVMNVKDTREDVKWITMGLSLKKKTSFKYDLPSVSLYTITFTFESVYHAISSKSYSNLLWMIIVVYSHLVIWLFLEFHPKLVPIIQSRKA